ncbi:hypothetical protein LCGC14_2240250, partial [marine sediment metagenome]
MAPDLANVLPKHMTPERVAKAALVAASRNPQLFECTRSSLALAMIKAGELGLDCSGRLGAGWLVPYWNGRIQAREAQFIPGYRGLIELAKRGGEVTDLQAKLVYANDIFSVVEGSDPHIEHRPCHDRDRGEIVGAYAIAWLRGAEHTVHEYMTVGEIKA